VAFSPDGQYIASGDVDGGVWLAETATGKEVLHLPGHNGFVTGVAFSPDGRRLASAGADNAVRIWNVPTGDELFTIRDNGPLVGVAFSPDGRLLASASGSPRHTVTIWHAQSGSEADTVSGPFSEAGFAPDGRLLGYADGKNAGTVAGIDVATGKVLLSYADSTDLHPTRVSRGNGRIAVLVDEGSPQRSVDPHGHVQAPAWRNIRVWDGASGQELFTLGGASGPFTTLALSRDGRLLATAGRDAADPTKATAVTLWDATIGKEIRTLLRDPRPICWMMFAPGSHRLALAYWADYVKLEQGAQSELFNTSVVRVWDTDAGREVFTLPGGVPVAFSPGDRQLVTTDGSTIQLWDAVTGKVIHSLRGHTDAVQEIAFTPDGQRLASAAPDEIMLWDVATGQEILTLRHRTRWWRSLGFSPDGRRLAAVDGDGHVRIWNGEPVDEGVGK
jgi:WD40 repeat protein